MKKSDIYKYALMSVITDLAAENRNGEADPERTYAIVGELCERIGTELKIEPVRERNLNARTEESGNE